MGELCESNEGDEENLYKHDDDDDERQNYVVWKMLLTPKVVKDLQRNRLFHARCTLNKNLFNLTIDGGSCENIISKHIVEKIKLPLEPYPEPYKLRWIRSIEKIKVNQRCRVLFSIGKYRDKTYCDMVGCM